MNLKCNFALLLACTLGLATSLAPAQSALTLQLPEPELLLPPVSPPQLQKEGLPLPAEQKVLGELLALIGTQQYEAGLTLLREDYETLLALIEAGDPEGSLKQLAVAGGFIPARTNQASATLLYLLGHTYLSLERFKEAELAFTSALIPLPDYLRIHESLGLLYLRTEQYAQAQQHLARAIALGLHTPNLFAALGAVNQQLNNHWGAIAAYQQAMMLEPDNRSWKQALLFSLSETSQYQSGLTLVDELLQQYPDDAALWLNRSNFALMADDESAALSSLETAIRLGENSMANLQVSASLHMQAGSVSRATELLQAGFAAGLDFIYMEQALIWLLQHEEFPLAQTLVDTLHQNWDQLSAVQRSSVLGREANLNLQANRQSQATTMLQEALELDPGNADALMSLAGIMLDTRNFGQAELLYQRASAYPGYVEAAQLNLARIAIDLNNYERALALLQEVATRNPGRTDLRRNIESLENLVLLQTGN